MVHNRYLSKDALRVVRHLADYQLPVFADEELFAIEADVLRWFPNHIISVINQCLQVKGRGGSGSFNIKRWMAAHERGYEYFSAALPSLLRKREGANRPGRPTAKEGAFEVWKTVQRLLIRTIDQEEAKIILTELPRFPIPDILSAIGICRQQQVHSPRYLLGILERAEQEQQGKARLRRKKLEQESKVWEPTSGPMDADRARELNERWQHRLEHDVEVLRDLRRYAQER